MLQCFIQNKYVAQCFGRSCTAAVVCGGSAQRLCAWLRMAVCRHAGAAFWHDQIWYCTPCDSQRSARGRTAIPVRCSLFAACAFFIQWLVCWIQSCIARDFITAEACIRMRLCHACTCVSTMVIDSLDGGMSPWADFGKHMSKHGRLVTQAYNTTTGIDRIWNLSLSNLLWLTLGSN